MEGENTPVHTHRINRQELIVHAVAEAIADLEDISPLQIESLYDSIDMEALETLLQSSNSHVEISFHYKHYRIEVVDSNIVKIFPIEIE